MASLRLSRYWPGGQVMTTAAVLGTLLRSFFPLFLEGVGAAYAGCCRGGGTVALPPALDLVAEGVVP